MLFKMFRYFVLMVAPVLLVFVEMHHPAGFKDHVMDALMPISEWWTTLHIIQAFFFTFICIAILILTESLGWVYKYLSRTALFFFAVCYLVFDAVNGIAIGVMLTLSEQGPADLDRGTLHYLMQGLFNHPVVGGVGSYFSLTGSWAWLISLYIMTFGIFMKEKANVALAKLLPPLALFLVSGYSLYVGHPYPYGPIAFSAFALANLWMEVLGIHRVEEG